MIRLVIPGKPVGKQSVRVASHAYTPLQTREYMSRIASIFTGTYPRHNPYDGAVEIRIYAFYPIPKSTSAKTRDLMLAGSVRPTSKPDWDNIGKIVSDSLNNLAYRDDKQIADGRVQSWYGNEPRIEIEVEEI